MVSLKARVISTIHDVNKIHLSIVPVIWVKIESTGIKLKYFNDKNESLSDPDVCYSNACFPERS